VTYSAGSFILFLLVHCLTWNLINKHNLGVYQILKIMLSTFIFMIVVNRFYFVFDLDIYLSISSYCALGLLYLHFYVGITRSVSIRLLGELTQAQGHLLTCDELERVYSMEFMLEHRLATLVDHGWLENNGVYYKCTKKGIMIAKIQLVMKGLFRIEQTG